MRLRSTACFLWLGVILLAQATAHGGDWPWLKKAKPGEPNTLEDVARSIDCLEDKVLDDGTVVLKKPDVYGQSRMTLYRKNFETQMYGAIGKFNAVVSARLYRSDQAALSSQTSVAAGLASANSKAKTTTATTTNVVTPPPVLPAATAGGITPDGLAANSIVRPGTIAGELGTTPFSFNGSLNPSSAGSVGLEPTVYLDELKDYQDHLNEIRRTNMGDDTADSAGYGLYLLRMPVSIQPGECTRKGHGAILTATVRHDFGPDFLPTTFRNLVVNDLVDQLTPIIYEMIRSNTLKSLPKDIKSPLDAEERYVAVIREAKECTDLDLYAIFLTQEQINPLVAMFCKPLLKDSTPGGKTAIQQIEESLKPVTDLIHRMTTIYGAMTRLNDRPFPIPGTEFDNVFLEQNLVMLAMTAQQASQTATPRSPDVRNFLRREIEAAYDIISQSYGSNDPDSHQIVEGFEKAVENIGLHIRTREYRALFDDYRELAGVLPGQLRYYKGETRDDVYVRDPNTSLIDPLTILCYSIAVEAGLLDQQLRVDMKRVFGKDGGDCSEIDLMRFYRPQPEPAAVAKFEEYVRRRWPLITFALDPQVDQQNIDDVNSTSRDLQIALAFAFSSGQINFQQLLQYQRKVVVDAEAVALNRTVTSFSHGDDTFGYRFTPRFQNAPPEKTNFGVIANTLIKGGQGRDYRVKNSQLEAGQRELNAVIIMPSFLQGIQMDVTGNWFPLHDPDQMMTPTPRMIEQGRKVVELREALNCIHDHKIYRKGDIQRLTTRVNQLEAMLPMQTQEIPLPYENTLGGFQLFQQGVTSLVPQLDAFEGVDAIQEGQEVDLVLYGKHFSIQETHIIAGGKYMALEPLDPGSSPPQAASAAPAASTPAASTPAASTPASAAPAASTPAASTPAASTPASAAPAASTPASAAPAASTPASAAAAATNGSSSGSVEVISRQVMRVHIPSGLVSTPVTDADGKTNPYIELYVATPNGISNRLLIPFAPKAAAAKPAALGYTLGVDAATVGFIGSIVKDTAGNVYFATDFAFDPTTSDQKPLTMTVESDLGLAPKSILVDFQATFDGASAPVHFKLPVTVPFDPVAKTYTIPLSCLADALKNNRAAFAQIIRDLAKNPSVTTDILLTPLICNPDFFPVPKKANGNLKVTIKLNNLPVPPGATHILMDPNHPVPIVPAPGGHPESPAHGATPGNPVNLAPPTTNPGPFTEPPGVVPNPGGPPASSTIHPIPPETGREVTPRPNPPTPSPTLPGGTSSRAPRAVPARDPDLKPSAYHRPAKGPGNLPPLPSSTRPAPSGPSSSPKPATGQRSAPANNPTARDPLKPATVNPTSSDTKANPASKVDDVKRRWPWQRP